jgi:hypothetical protein
LAICLVELNLAEFPLPLPSLWCLDLDFGATHHVNSNRAIFFDMQHMNGINLYSVGGQGHDITSIGDVNIQSFNGVINNIPHILYLQSKRICSLLGSLLIKFIALCFFEWLFCVKLLY